MTDNLVQGKEAHDRLMVGIEKVATAVAATYGAAGSNAVLEASERPGHRVINDGVSVANAIYLADPVENIGANIIKEIASRADKESGDGTTTSVILARAILSEGLKSTESPMTIKRSLDECLPLIMDAIDAQKRDITVDEVGKVATISAESEELGALIQEAYQTIGKDGIIELDNSNLPTTFIEYSEGVRLRFAGYLGEYSTTSVGRAEYKNPLVAISKEKITTTEQVEKIAKKLPSLDQVLVLYVEDIEMTVASRLALTHIQSLMKGEQGLKTLIIKAPTLWKDWLYEDIGKLTGATPIDFANGKTFNNFSEKDFGTCDKIISTKDETRLIGTKDISDHIKDLREKGELDDQQKVRASWLETKVAILKLGANSDSELSYRRLKAIDAISASKLALEDGVIAGGGVALLNASKSMPDTVGGTILSKALKAPILQIIENAGGLAEVYAYSSNFTKEQAIASALAKGSPVFVPSGGEVQSIKVGLETLTGDEGFNAKTLKVEDMWEAGIVDPAKVVKNSVKNALSVASTVLTASVVVHLPRPDALQTLKEALTPKQYG